MNRRVDPHGEQRLLECRRTGCESRAAALRGNVGGAGLRVQAPSFASGAVSGLEPRIRFLGGGVSCLRMLWDCVACLMEVVLARPG